jgi:hypothetical protein
MVGMSDLGGVKFFNLSVETPAGDMELLEFVLEGEWRRGGGWAAWCCSCRSSEGAGAGLHSRWATRAAGGSW